MAVVQKISLIGNNGLESVGQALSSLEGPLYIVAIVGPAREGKSTVLNGLGARLAADEGTCSWPNHGAEVFQTWSRSAPCTAGVDLAIIPRKNGNGHWILLDCEGLFVDQQLRGVPVTKLVALASQLCSTLLFLDMKMDDRLLTALGEKVLFQAIAQAQATYPQLIVVLNRYNCDLNDVSEVKAFLETKRTGPHSRTAEVEC